MLYNLYTESKCISRKMITVLEWLGSTCIYKWSISAISSRLLLGEYTTWNWCLKFCLEECRLSATNNGALSVFFRFFLRSSVRSAWLFFSMVLSVIVVVFGVRRSESLWILFSLALKFVDICDAFPIDHFEEHVLLSESVPNLRRDRLEKFAEAIK